MSKTGLILFWPGEVVATPGALEAIKASGDSPFDLLVRHMTGDWREMDEHDRKENELSVKRDFRILSSYTLSNGTKVWIITEADRSATTFLLPEEY